MFNFNNNNKNKLNAKCNSVLNDNDTTWDDRAEDYSSVPKEIKDHSVKLQSRQQPGVYMILCLMNNYRYYGETSNLSLRLAGHKRDLRQKKHANKNLQNDWNTFGETHFEFSVLFIGPEWEKKETRLEKEVKLILAHPSLCYNTYAVMSDRIEELNQFYGKKHIEKTKKLIGDLQRNIPKDALGSKVHIEGKSYASIAEASRQLKHSRKLVRKRVDSLDYPKWYRLSETPNDYP